MTDSTQEAQKVRHDWYQTETHVVINILCKNVKPEDFNIKYGPELAVISFSVENGANHNLKLNLLYEINPSACSYKISPSKVEIKLMKKETIWWSSLEKDGTKDNNVKQVMTKTYPSSSLKPKDWDKVVGDMTNKDDDKLEGEAALNALFQKIYSEGSDEVRRAMNKSFTESAGTVLSTNWKEIEKEKVNMKPPDGMEWKKWD